MKMNFFLLALFLFFGLFAHAKGGSSKNWELRVDFGSFNKASSDFDKQMEDFVYQNPDLDPPKLSGADLIYKLPSSPYVLGLRYEIIELTKSGHGYVSNGGALTNVDTKLSGYRAGLLGGWHFFNSDKGYAGLLGHVIISQSMNYTTKSTNFITNAVVADEYFKGSPEVGYGLAFDAGFTLQEKANIGAEIGYTSYASNSFKDGNGNAVHDNSGKDIKLDLSGLYYKLVLGFLF